jgi:hypothetical protein
MKHADAATLDKLKDLLQQLRTLDALRERTRGVFYLRSKPFLHFHDDPTGLYADLRTGEDFQRYPVNSTSQCKVLVSAVRDRMAPLG